MRVTHEITDYIVESPNRIFFPVSAESRLRAGFFAELIGARGKDYADFAKEWDSQDKKAIVDATGFLRGIKANVIVAAVKKTRVPIPMTVDPARLGRKVAVQCKKHGWTAIALAKSHCKSAGFSNDGLESFVVELEKENVEVHIYE
jgi:hypothetical protein